MALASMSLLIHCTGRHRWVVYKDLSWPTGQEATSVAPDWHGEIVVNASLCLLYHCLHQAQIRYRFIVQVGYTLCTMFPHLR